MKRCCLQKSRKRKRKTKFEGLFFLKKKELIKPIQDEVYKAVKELALEGGYAVIFDTASGSGILYENARYNKSDDVLKKLGY